MANRWGENSGFLCLDGIKDKAAVGANVSVLYAP